MRLRVLRIVFRLALCHLGLLVILTFLPCDGHVIGGVSLAKLGCLPEVINSYLSSDALQHSTSPLVTVSAITPFARFLDLSDIIILFLVIFLGFLQVDFGPKITFHTLGSSHIIRIS